MSKGTVASHWLIGGGEMGERIRAFDWSGTAIGPMDNWSPTLRMMVRFLLANRFPLLLWWGPEYVSIYNDAYRPVLGTKHSWGLGRPLRECWSEIWLVLQPLVDTPFRGGEPTWNEDIRLEINRHGFIEETHFTIAYSPVPDDSAPSGIGGVLATVHETTEKVVSARRLAALRDLGARTIEAKTAESACCIAADTLSRHPHDVPFALVYLLDADGRQATLCGAAGLDVTSRLDKRLALDSSDPGKQPLVEAVRTGKLQVIDDLGAAFGLHLPQSPWSDPPAQAVVVPIRSSMAHQVAGILLAGVSARLKLDEPYRSFYELLASQIATAISSARAYEAERKRAEALAEIDRAKTAFFSNVSHEFRTPLTLMLGPLEDALAHASGLDAAQRERLETAHRNARRLLKLVNTLLDFSRIEAGRTEACFEPTDLAQLTAEFASVFRSAIERAGMGLVIDCHTLPRPVMVDHDAWEKIVLNLLSNAFKFTLEGEIRVTLRPVGDVARLSVADTGCGIPSDQLPHIFERFHRIEGQRGRSIEGSGIGLALAQELVRLHGGTMQVASAVGRGTTFTVDLPLALAEGTSPPGEGFDRLGEGNTAAVFVEEASRWLAAIDPPHQQVGPSSVRETTRARIVFADDNRDMRDYLARLLSAHWDVEAVANGREALDAVRRRRPDLLISDIMMPDVGGLELLAAIRADPELAILPAILLSARAGEEAQVEALGVGADDYIVKPFAAQELVARVKSTLALSRLRRESSMRVEQAEARLQAASDLVGLSPYSWDPATGELEWDDRIRAMWGLPPGAPVDTDVFLSAIHPDDRPKVEAEIGRCVDPRGDGIYALEYRVIGIADKIERWVQTYGQTVFEHGCAVSFVGAVMEITERKRAQARLQDSEQRFRSFAENVNGVLWIADPRSGEMEYVSPAYARIWGRARPTLPSSLDQWKQTLHPDDVPHVASMLDRAAQGETVTYEYRIVRPNGATPWIRDTTFPIRDQHGRVGRVAGVAYDITRHGGGQIYLVGGEHSRGSTLASMLRNAGYEVKAFASVREFLAVAAVLVAGCALVDLAYADRGDLPLLRHIPGRPAGMPIVMLGGLQDDIVAAVRAMRVGAADYIPRPFDDGKILDAIASAFTLIDQSVLRGHAENQAVARLARLSSRERQVLDGILAGGTNKSIARALGLSPRTVEQHRSNMMEKIGVKTLREAIEIAFTAGLKLSGGRPRSRT